MSCSDCLDDVCMRDVARVHTLLNVVVDGIWWHHMPICSVGASLSNVLFNSKHAGYVYKVTVAVDNLGNMVWI